MRTLALTLCMILSISSVSHAAVAEGSSQLQPGVIGGGAGVAQPYYVNTARISAGLKIDGSTAYCNADVTAKNTNYKICVTMYLQRLESNSWKNVCSWMEFSSNGFKNMTHSYTLTKHGTYRTYAIFEVGGETLTYTSSSSTY